MKQQAIIWTSVDQDIWCHTASLGHSELTVYTILYYDTLALCNTKGLPFGMVHVY